MDSRNRREDFGPEKKWFGPVGKPLVSRIFILTPFIRYIHVSHTRWAPTSQKNGVITPISKVITPIIHSFQAIYKGPKTPFRNDRQKGPTLYVR